MPHRCRRLRRGPAMLLVAAAVAACGSGNAPGGSSGIAACENGKPVCQGAGDVPDDTPCGDGGRVCSAGACVPPTCGATPAACQPADPCKTGETSCKSATALPTCTVTGNLPDGSSCGPGAICTSGTCGPVAAPVCTNPPQPSAAAHVQHFAGARVGQQLSFDVPPGTASVTIVEQDVTAPSTIAYRTSRTGAVFTLDNTAIP